METQNKQIFNSKRTIFILLLAVLMFGNIFFITKYFVVQTDLNQAQAAVETQKINASALRFTKLFIAKVLKAKSEVDFETRLNLENTVRDLKDPEILAQWQKFTDSQAESEAQQNVKDLLELLVNKISP
jgi:hypothetical protein